MTLTKQQVADYKKDGYIVLKGFFEKEKIAAIFYDIRQVFALQFQEVLGHPYKASMAASDEEFSQLMFDLYKKDFDTFSNCSKQVQNTALLHQLGASGQVINILKELDMAQPIISVRPCVLMNSIHLDKGETGKYWRIPTHQDWYYSQGSLDSVTIWTPYVACDKALGALEFIPGSHLWGLQKTGEDCFGEMTENYDDDRFIHFNTEPGDTIIFYSLMVHRSGTNVTDRVRWSTQFRYSNLLEPTFIKRRFPLPFVYHPTRVLETPEFPNKVDMEKAVSF